MKEPINLTVKELSEVLTVSALATNPDLLPDIEDIQRRFFNDISKHEDINKILSAYQALFVMSKKVA